MASYGDLRHNLTQFKTSERHFDFYQKYWHFRMNFIIPWQPIPKAKLIIFPDQPNIALEAPLTQKDVTFYDTGV